MFVVYIQNIHRKNVEKPIFYLCSTFPYFYNKNIFFYLFKVIWNCTIRISGFSAIAIMACKVRSLCIEK